jgi:hypothetical protein
MRITRFYVAALVLCGLAPLAIGGCAYHFGYTERSLPGGFKQVAIPVFQNISIQVGAEKYFTEALIREFDRSQVAEVTSMAEAPVTIEGHIKKITYVADSLVQAVGPGNTTTQAPTNSVLAGELPSNTALATEYRVIISAYIEIRQNSDHKIIWKGNFDDERTYVAPQLVFPVINSADALYNQGYRLEVIQNLAADMMHAAHDRMTENF